MFQNLMHPKNSQRREAIEEKSYLEIRTSDDAISFFKRVLSMNFKNELATRETQFRVKIGSAKASNFAEAFLQAPNKYYAAAILM